MTLYVEDLAIVGHPAPISSELKSNLGRRVKRKDLGELEIEVQRNLQTKTVSLSQFKYLSDTLKLYGMHDWCPH